MKAAEEWRSADLSPRPPLDVARVHCCHVVPIGSTPMGPELGVELLEAAAGQGSGHRTHDARDAAPVATRPQEAERSLRLFLHLGDVGPHLP